MGGNPAPVFSGSVSIGPPGVDGSSYRSGLGPPPPSLGKPNDTYRDETGLLLYTKTGSGWGAGIAVPSAITTTSIPPVIFSFGDASPKIIATLPRAMMILAAKIQMITAFNGAASHLCLGTPAAPQSLISEAQVDATQVLLYGTNPSLPLETGSQIVLTITPGAGCTRGTGWVVIHALPT